MSVQFGRWHYEGAPPTPGHFEKVHDFMETYGPDKTCSYSAPGLNILYSALHATKESPSETQPQVTRSRAVLTWDGRLDNRAEFTALMSDRLRPDSSEVSVVASAYERWGTLCFARLLGDWALSIWDPDDRSLVLAKDPIGTRPLYYSPDRSEVTWSSLLDPLVLFGGKTPALDEEYIAGYFSLFPNTHLTPYRGVLSVPPNSFVRIEPGKETIHKYWNFDPRKRIHYRTDVDYQEHFRTVFQESVRRRLRSASPVLAELSGGMDSCSIVCVADAVISEASAETSRLDTLSYFSDSEPNWNERPYFTKVERKRGRAGCHIDLGEDHPFPFEAETVIPQATPGSRPRYSQSARQRAACLRQGGYRVLLSGIGGDEVTGGVPTPVPELADLLARAHFGRLAHQLKVWALAKRKPWFHLLFETASRFLPRSIGGSAKDRQPPPWLDPTFVKRHQLALSGYQNRLQLSRTLPSFQESMSTLDALRRQLACDDLPSDPPYEKRYPYLDRDLLEFLFAIPREQLVRPGERRSLMRRALTGIVPDEILHRRRKAYMSRTPLAAISQDWDSFAALSTNMVTASLGIVNAGWFTATLERARQGKEVPIVSLMRTLELEIWLRSWKQYMSSNRQIATNSIGLSSDKEQSSHCSLAEVRQSLS
jgi:asparagine synthase (glutamine-hydrolysing)